VDLLYRHSWEIAWILLKNEGLKDQTRDVLKELLPITRSFLDGTEITFTPERMAEVTLLLDEFEKKASPSLRNALDEVRGDLRDLGYLEDSYEDDDTFVNASVVVVNDDPQSHNFHDAGDQDWVKLYGLEGYPYTVKTTDLGANCDTVLHLYDEDGLSLLKGPVDDQRYGEDEILSWSCENDGVYYVMAKQYDSSDYGEATDYDLVVFTPLGPLTGVITGIVTDSGTGIHIDEAIVTSDIGGAAITMAGYYVMITPAGICTVTASMNGYQPASRSNIVVEDGGETTADFSLERMTGNTCPAALALNNDESRLSILRDFRDKVLNRKLPSLRASELYYKHSLELASIFRRDAKSREETAHLLRELMPEIQSVIEGGTMTVTKNQLDNILTLMRRVASQAHPDLKEALDELIWELGSGQFVELEGVGINIPVN